ncbi:MAG: hypothetical protein D6768_15515, partial [Chloroflexi bacterium]
TPAERHNLWRWAQSDGNIGPASFITPDDENDAAELARRGYLKSTDEGFCIHPCWRSWLRSRRASEFPPPESLAFFVQNRRQRLYLHCTGAGHVQARLNGDLLDFGAAGWLLHALCRTGPGRVAEFPEIAALRPPNSNSPARTHALDDINHAFEQIQAVLESHGLNAADYVEAVMNRGFRLTENVVCQASA